MIILGIETSCDETAAAVVGKTNNKFSLLSSIVASSEELHKKTGGIVPEVAARQQTKSIVPVIDKAINKAKISLDKIDAIAVTYGPGLIGSLLVGVETAKTLSYCLNKPIIPVNHLHGHLLVNWLEKTPELPAVGLVVSGGHTDFVLINKKLEIRYLGGTRDDASGEAFDKTARIIELGYPGGPAISKLADQYIQNNPEKTLDIFPRPMIDSNNLDMSFSGLKTAVLNYTKNISNYDKPEVAANIQEAIVDTLIAKSLFAIKKYNPSSFILSGGVSANSRLSEKLKFSLQTMAKLEYFYVPQPQYSTDNAVMIAVAAVLKNNSIGWKNLKANPSLNIDE